MSEMLNGSILQDKNGQRLQIMDQAARDQAAQNAERIGKLSEEIANITGGNKTAFDAFMDNTDVDYAYDEATGAYYTVIRIYKDKLDGTKQYPFVLFPNDGQARTTYDLVMQDGYFLAINGGIFNNATTPDGMVIQNGVVMQNSVTTLHPNCKPLMIDGDGNLGYAADDADANDLVAAGIVSAVSGFMPIVVDYAAVPDTEWNAVSHYTQNAQRQIIGQWGCGDYAIITCEGRSNHNSDGWTIAEAQQICIKHGLKFAYNLDGGGSTETMLGKKHINTIYENETGRRVPTFIVFNGTTTLDKTPVVPEPEETYTTLEYVQFTKEQYVETGVAESETFGAEAVISVDEVGDAGSHLVSAKNSYVVTFVGGGKPTVKRCGSSEVSTTANADKVVAGTQYTIRAFVDDNSARWNDTVITDNLAAGNTLSGNYIIGGYAGRADSATYRMACKLYALKFYDGGTLTHNFVPSISSSGEVGLLETISNTFHHSSTDTPLVAGPSVS